MKFERINKDKFNPLSDEQLSQTNGGKAAVGVSYEIIAVENKDGTISLVERMD